MCSIGVILPICMALAISISSVCYVVGVIGSVAKLNVIKFIFTVELIFANSCGGNTVIFIIIEIRLANSINFCTCDGVFNCECTSIINLTIS